MKLKAVSGTMLTILLIGMLSLAFDITPVATVDTNPTVLFTIPNDVRVSFLVGHDGTLQTMFQTGEEVYLELRGEWLSTGTHHAFANNATFTISNGTSYEVWNRTMDHPIGEGWTSGPGGSWGIGVHWRQVDNLGNPVPPGTYKAGIRFSANPGFDFPEDFSTVITFLILARAQTHVFVDPAMIEGEVIGENVTVNINVSNVTDLYGWQAGMTFNPNVLNCTGYYEGEFLERGADPELGTIWLNQTPPCDNTEGIVYFHGCCLLGPVSGVSGSGQLGYLTFEVVGTGISDMHLTDVILCDSKTERIPHEVVDSFTVSWGEVDFSVETISNLTGIWGESSSGLFNHTFSQPEKEISFDVITPYDSCYNVTIPAELLSGDLAILIDNVSKDFILTQNASHTSLYFTHSHSTHNIKIKGTTAIPEFPSFIILPLFMIATLLAIIVYRRKRTTNS